MTHIDAVYRDGVFQPLGPVQLPDEQRVRLSIETVPAESPEAWLSRVRSLQGTIISRSGILPDSTPDIAADRIR